MHYQTPVYDYFLKELPPRIRWSIGRGNTLAPGALPIVRTFQEACGVVICLTRALDRSASAVNMPAVYGDMRKFLLASLLLMLSEYFPSCDCTVKSMVRLLDSAGYKFGSYTSTLELMFAQLERGENYTDTGSGKCEWVRTMWMRNSDGKSPGEKVNGRRGFTPSEDETLFAFDLFRRSCPRDMWSSLVSIVRLSFDALARECGYFEDDGDDLQTLLRQASSRLGSGELDALDQLMMASLSASITAEPRGSDLSSRYIALLKNLI